jgi:hypothetical protein
MMYPEGTVGYALHNRDFLSMLVAKGSDNVYGAMSSILARLQDSPGEFIDLMQVGLVNALPEIHNDIALNDDTRTWMAERPYKNIDHDFWGDDWKYFHSNGFDMTDSGFAFLVMIMSTLLGAPIVKSIAQILPRILKRSRENKMHDQDMAAHGKSHDMLDDLDNSFEVLLDSLFREEAKQERDGLGNLVRTVANAIRYNDRGLLP